MTKLGGLGVDRSRPRVVVTCEAEMETYLSGPRDMNSKVSPMKGAPFDPLGAGRLVFSPGCNTRMNFAVLFTMVFACLTGHLLVSPAPAADVSATATSLLDLIKRGLVFIPLYVFLAVSWLAVRLCILLAFASVLYEAADPVWR